MFKVVRDADKAIIQFSKPGKSNVANLATGRVKNIQGASVGDDGGSLAFALLASSFGGNDLGEGKGGGGAWLSLRCVADADGWDVGGSVSSNWARAALVVV